MTSEKSYKALITLDVSVWKGHIISYLEWASAIPTASRDDASQKDWGAFYEAVGTGVRGVVSREKTAYQLSGTPCRVMYKSTFTNTKYVHM